uniref:Uncharacterized protein n=1 Tax=Tanacetum cinerariifolium TaxID=118510 RepID=A0A6L2MCU5_TANCI|nr:hypothetical protein [Tanacetum cinerariifolium]
MLIPDAFLTKIRATDDYAEYETVFAKVVVLKIQLQPVVSTQGMHKTTPSAYRPPTLTVASPQKKKEKQIARETTTLLSLTLHKIALATEAQENIAKVKEKLEEEEEIEKMKEKKDDKNDDEKANDDEKTDETGSMETMKEKTHTSIPSPTRSHRTDLSLDKTLSEELTATVSPSTATTSKDKRITKAKSKTRSTSIKSKILPGSIVGVCRRRGLIRTHLKSTFVTNEFFMGKIREVLDHYNNVVPELTFAKTNEMLKAEVPMLVNLEVN